MALHILLVFLISFFFSEFFKLIDSFVNSYTLFDDSDIIMHLYLYDPSKPVPSGVNWMTSPFTYCHTPVTPSNERPGKKLRQIKSNPPLIDSFVFSVWFDDYAVRKRRLKTILDGSTDLGILVLDIIRYLPFELMEKIFSYLRVSKPYTRKAQSKAMTYSRRLIVTGSEVQTSICNLSGVAGKICYGVFAGRIISFPCFSVEYPGKPAKPVEVEFVKNIYNL